MISALSHSHISHPMKSMFYIQRGVVLVGEACVMCEYSLVVANNSSSHSFSSVLFTHSSIHQLKMLPKLLSCEVLA